MIAYALPSVLFTLLLIISPLIIAKNVNDNPSPRRDEQILIAAILFSIVLLVTLLLLFTVYGLYKTKPWARTTALILATMVIMWFPLGTALGIYTWWFMHSEGGKQLYLKP
jgi:hypothetical protein